MRSRVHPKYNTKYHVRNWASYEQALVQRGDVTVWLSPDAIASWEPEAGGRRGGQWKYSDVAIETAFASGLDAQNIRTRAHVLPHLWHSEFFDDRSL